MVSLSVVCVGLPAWAAVAQTPKPASQQQVEKQMEEMANIRITVDATEILATLDDNVAANEFMSQLPMTLVLEDYNNTEKVSDLPGRLPTTGTPEGLDPAVGDITYYAPWGNLAIFYRDFGYSRGLVRLGRIESGIEILEQPGPLKVTIERLE